MITINDFGIPDDLFFTPSEAADILKIHRQNIYPLLGEEIPVIILSRKRRRIPRQGLIDYLSRKMEGSNNVVCDLPGQAH